MENPTPAGVLRVGYSSRDSEQASRAYEEHGATDPVRMTVPAGRVVPCDKKDTILGTEKIKSL